MTCSPKAPSANRSAQLGMRSEQIACPDVRQETTKILCPPKIEDEEKFFPVTLGPTLAQLLEARKVSQAALAGFLAIVKSNCEAFGRVPDEYQGACNVPIPVEVIALIGEKLVGKARWSKEKRDARTETADKKHVDWQEKADDVWRKNKKLSLTAVAQRIAPDNWNYVRQLIRKPKK